MSEENNGGQPKFQRTPEEIEATVAKLRAEAAKAEAETRKALADAEKAEVSAEKEREKRTKELAGDDYHRVYRFNGSVESASTKTCMAQLTEWSRLDPGCSIEIIFSSPGGSIIDGMALFDFTQQLRAKGHHITSGTVGMAASMAGILLQIGDKRWMGHQSWLMIHRAAFGIQGQTFDVEDRVKWIKRIEDRILDIFVSRSNLTKRKIKGNWDRKDWWITSEEALGMGLIDEIRGDPSDADGVTTVDELVVPEEN